MPASLYYKQYTIITSHEVVNNNVT